jgi:hypothetical protein
LLIYKDQKTFDQRPTDSLNKRPILLSRYKVQSSDDSAGFLLFLLPRDGVVSQGEENVVAGQLVFMCDTAIELQEWHEVFNTAILSS